MAGIFTPEALYREHVHFVGIGGIGLSAIARLLLAWGARVSGSDLHLSSITDDLVALGATVYEGHRAEHVRGATAVVISSAIRPDNAEVVAAKELGIPVYKRSDILGMMMAGRHGVAVAGTHGKTTTTAMIVHILRQAGCDPTFIVGGIMQDLGSNAAAGRGPHFVIEADEYDHMFLGLAPRTAVVTHLEMDHPDCFPTLDAMIAEFQRFLSLVPVDGQIVACLDEPNVRRLLAGLPTGPGPRLVTYGLSGEAAWRAADVRANELGGSDFHLLCDDRTYQVRLCIPGLHNVKNALGALAVVDLVGIDVEAASDALSHFRGVRRRFEIKGEAQGIAIIDDYAHHPTEIRATLQAARQRFPSRPIWAVFQPHTFSRTKALFAEFANAFGDADHVLVTDIYAAREQPDPNISAESLVAAMNHADARWLGRLDSAIKTLLAELKPGDVLITMGAGDGYTIGERVLHKLQSGHRAPPAA